MKDYLLRGYAINQRLNALEDKVDRRMGKTEREVVLESGGEKHRADILHDGVAVEFQHSPISEKEFWRRSVFYTKAARHLLWVFDVRQRFEAGRIEEVARDAARKSYLWHGHRPTFCGFIPESYPSITLVLQFTGTDNGENVSLCEVTRVDGVPLFSQFESVDSQLGELPLREWIDVFLIPKLDLVAVHLLPIVPNIVTHRRTKTKASGGTGKGKSESETNDAEPPSLPLEEPGAATSTIEQHDDMTSKQPRKNLPADKCPECGADMVLRPGLWADKIVGFGRKKLDPFWGCATYAYTHCPGKRKATPPKCPQCGNTMEAKKSYYENGKAYWRCPVCGRNQSAVLKP